MAKEGSMPDVAAHAALSPHLEAVADSSSATRAP